jgi:hypothetical protein
MKFLTWLLIGSTTLKKYPVYFPFDPFARHIHTFLLFTFIMRKTSLSDVWVATLGDPSAPGVSRSENMESASITPLIDAACCWLSFSGNSTVKAVFPQ